MKSGYKVADAMTVKPIIVGPEISVEEAAQKMQIQKIGSLIISENDNLLGIVTEKDFVDKVLAKSLDPKKTKVKEIMTSIVHTTSPNEDLIEAIRKMAKANVKRLPVVNDNKLVGFLTSKDVLAIQPELFDIMTERFHIRECDRKPHLASGEGQCDECGNITLVRKKGNECLCYECINRKVY
ncbi:MAG: CBS domain-containing protein [Nanoarchaeota archaeon]|nr:CBS domain-containing protein [Nanoarchaeota archaeon]MBU0962407.1 CBS domain-containing protein [Nanoarchaeota archaeon]